MEKLVLTGLTTIGSLCGGGEGINNEINVEQIIEKLNNPLPAVTYQGEIPKPLVELVDIYWDNPYIPSPDSLSTCVVEEEVSETDKNICPTDEELVKMGLVPTEEEWEETIEETGEKSSNCYFSEN